MGRGNIIGELVEDAGVAVRIDCDLRVEISLDNLLYSPLFFSPYILFFILGFGDG